MLIVFNLLGYPSVSPSNDQQVQVGFALEDDVRERGTIDIAELSSEHDNVV